MVQMTLDEALAYSKRKLEKLIESEVSNKYMFMIDRKRLANFSISIEIRTPF